MLEGKTYELFEGEWVGGSMRFVLMVTVLVLSLFFGCAMKSDESMLNPTEQNTISLEECIKQTNDAFYGTARPGQATMPLIPSYNICQGGRSTVSFPGGITQLANTQNCLIGTEVGQRTDTFYCTFDYGTCQPIVETANNMIIRKYNARYQETYTYPKNDPNARNYSSCKITITDVN